MSTTHKAELGSAFITLGWGASYILCDIALEEMGPLTLNAVIFMETGEK